MPNIENRIQNKLIKAFGPAFLKVENESHKHNVPPGSESHFKVTVVSAKFDGSSMLRRHQMINEVLREELSGAVHALSISAKTPEQWDSSAGLIQPSPPCLGGNKAG